MSKLIELAKDIGVNYQQLKNIINYSDNFYNTFYLTKKKKDKKRIIDSPNSELKGIQRWILLNVLNQIKISDRANGFIIGRGIKRNAAIHLNKKYVLCIDIKDFFPSIKFKQVYECLLKGLGDQELSYKITKLCTYKNYLPQGAPTSPALSNIVFKPIDDEITKLCNSSLISFSRYADDLTFSSDNRQALVDIISRVKKILNKYSFYLNQKKTRIYSGKGKMIVTGITINSGKLSVGKNIKRNIRSSLFNLIIKKDTTINKNKLFGYLSFVKDIEPEFYKKIMTYNNSLLRKQVNLSIRS